MSYHFLIILSFPKVRSTCTCSRTLLLSYPLGLCASFAAGPSPRLVRGTWYASRTPFVISPRYCVCYGPWSRCPVRSTVHAVGSMSVRPVRSTILLSDVCQTVHSVGSFHLPFRLPFLLSFALSSALSSALSRSFPFLSPPRPWRKLFLGDTSCNRFSSAFTLDLSPPPHWFAKPRRNNYLSNVIDKNICRFHCKVVFICLISF
jgi:hypothetical protein